MKKIGFDNNLRELRKHAEIAYPTFSQETGTTVKNIVNIEKGQQPGVQLAYKMVSALGLSPKCIVDVFPPKD